MRMGCDLLSISGFSVLGNGDLEPYPPRTRFYREFAVNQTNSLPDDHGPLPHFLEIGLRKSSREGEPAPVVLHCKLPVGLGFGQAHQNVFGSAVFANVDQALLDDAGEFAAYPLRHLDLVQLRREAGANAGFALKTLDRIPEKPEEGGGVDIERLHLLHELAEFQDLLAKQALDTDKFGSQRAGLGLTTQY